MRSPRVLILYNEPVLPADHPDADSEHEILWTADVVGKNLVEAGFEVSRLGTSHDPDLLVSGLCRHRPDVVFNLFEGTADDATNESCVAGILEWLGIPFTGSPAHTLCLARNKHLAKQIFRGAGLQTPEFMVVESLPVPECELEWPVIVKPALQDASVGMDQGSVVTDRQKLEERVAYLFDNYGPPVLVEQFIRGREFSLALIEVPELQMLPISEILFVEKDPNYWPIITYDAKWKPGTRDYEATPPRYPAEVAPKLAEKLETLAKQAFRLLGCRDYARVDFRVRSNCKPYILEVNPNPCFAPTAGLAGGLGSAGLTHAQFSVDLVRKALARGGKAKPVRTPAVKPTLVRPFQPGDLAAVRKMGEACGVFLPGEHSPAVPSPAWLEKGPPTGYDCLVAEQGGKVVGFLNLGTVPRTEGCFQIHALAVSPPSQGKGVGWHLLQAAETKIKSGGGRNLVAETSSLASSSLARQFLLRQGFRLVGDVPDFYREGEARLTYIKFLTPAGS